MAASLSVIPPPDVNRRAAQRLARPAIQTARSPGSAVTSVSSFTSIEWLALSQPLNNSRQL
jgi:hypothetical protein